MLRELDKLGFEIGAHTVDHPPDLKTLSYLEVRNQIFDNKKYLTNILQKPVEHFCYPKGKYGDREVEIVKKTGFRTARTTQVLNIKKPDDPFRIKPSIHMYPNRKEYNDGDWIHYAYKLFDDVFKKNKGDYFHVWGHAWEISKFRLWNDLEKIFVYYNSILKDIDYKTI